MSLKYRGLRNWKYQVMERLDVETGIEGTEFSNGFLALDTSGLLSIMKGYCWDGPSGPTWDSRSAMRPSLVHDALYQLMRMGKLDPDHKQHADDLFHKMLREDGMGRFRAWYYWKAVRWFGPKYDKAEKPPPLREAP